MVLLGGSAALSVGVTVAIVVALVRPAMDFFQEVPIGEFLTGTRWAPTFADPDFGVFPLVTGTLSDSLSGPANATVSTPVSPVLAAGGTATLNGSDVAGNAATPTPGRSNRVRHPAMSAASASPN